MIVPRHRPGGLAVRSSRNYLQLEAFASSFGELERGSLLFVRFEEVGIVIGVAFNGFPGNERVLAGTDAAERESSALVGDGFAVVIGARAQAWLGDCDHERVRSRFTMVIDRDAFDDGSINAHDQVKGSAAAAQRWSGVIQVASAG